MSSLDPNRYATGVERDIILNNVKADQAVCATLDHRETDALKAVHETTLALRAAQEAVASAQSNLAHVQSLKATLYERIDSGRGLLHPVRRLPDELLAMFFLCCLDPEDILHDQRSIPFDLASVCRRWRTVALTTASLWRMLWVKLNVVHDPASAARCTNFIQVHMARAAQVPLEITVKEFVVAGPVYSHEILWRQIRFLVPRAGSLSVYSSLDIRQEIQLLFRESAPQLKELDISYRADDGDRTVLPFFAWAPKLERVVIAQVASVVWTPMRDSTGSLTTSLELLTHDKIDCSGFLEIFTRFPMLYDLEIGPVAFTSPTSRSVRHENLRQLDITIDDLDDFGAGTLVLPALEKAKVILGDIDDPDSIATLLRTTLCNVRDLTLDLTVVESLAHSLKACTNLQSLRFPYGYIGETAEQFFDAFAAPDTDGKWICPKLEMIHLSLDSPDPMPDGCDDALLRLAEARGYTAWAHTAQPCFWPLREIELDYNPRSSGMQVVALEKKLNDLLA